jgi:hypothetical protein
LKFHQAFAEFLADYSQRGWEGTKSAIRSSSQLLPKFIKIYFTAFSFPSKNQTYLFQLAKPQKYEENRNGKNVPARE